MSLAMRKVKLVSLKFDSQTNVTVAGLNDEPNFWLIIAFALNEKPTPPPLTKIEKKGKKEKVTHVVV